MQLWKNEYRTALISFIVSVWECFSLICFIYTYIHVKYISGKHEVLPVIHKSPATEFISLLIVNQ